MINANTVIRQYHYVMKSNLGLLAVVRVQHSNRRQFASIHIRILYNFRWPPKNGAQPCSSHLLLIRYMRYDDCGSRSKILSKYAVPPYQRPSCGKYRRAHGR